jgi:hypothetical protein
MVIIALLPVQTSLYQTRVKNEIVTLTIHMLNMKQRTPKLDRPREISLARKVKEVLNFIIIRARNKEVQGKFSPSVPLSHLRV